MATITSQVPSYAATPQTTTGAVGRSDKTVFAFGGEGAHSPNTDISLLQASPAWAECAAAAANLDLGDLEEFLQVSLGSHTAPSSPLVTTVINICLCELWRSWGFAPAVAFGHSVGEVAAAYCCGLYDVEQALRLARALGHVAARQPGAMLHTSMKEIEACTFPQDELALAAINVRTAGKDPAGEDEAPVVHVTLCGPEAAVAAWLQRDPQAARMKPAHPWHHPSYAALLTPHDRAALADFAARAPGGGCVLVSSVTGAVLEAATGEHWQQWLCNPVEIPQTVACVAAQVGGASPVVVEIGAHPVMAEAVQGLAAPSLCASSMCRGHPGPAWILEQRARLGPHRPLAALAARTFHLSARSATIDPHTDFPAQGLVSRVYVPLANQLQSFFPGLRAHDLYRFTSLRALVEGFGVPSAAAPSAPGRALVGPGGAGTLGAAGGAQGTQTTEIRTDIGAAVMGVGLCLPGGVDDEAAFWAALSQGEDAILQGTTSSTVPGKKYTAGYLDPASFSAAQRAQAFGIDKAEASAIDPQHVFALHLTERMFATVPKEVQGAMKADPDRAGVYLGCWQPAPAPPPGTPASAYRTLGNSLSVIASRVANYYNLNGPAQTVNTACSSSLVAVDAALRDMRAGRIDFAIVGGVNLLSDDAVTEDLKRATFLSPTGRCHTFEASADGYVRSEGGAVLLLQVVDRAAAPLLPPGARAVIAGSAVNQNRQTRPITAVDPVAQEKVVRAALADAGIGPGAVVCVECHGTGTKLGDPVEVSALAAAMGPPRAHGRQVLLTAAKRQFGHLESAAGAVGLLKAVLMAERSQCVAAKVEKVSPAVAAAMEGSCLAFSEAPHSSAAAAIAADGFIGVSSFGFAGNNAHVVVCRASGPGPAARALAPGPWVSSRVPRAVSPAASAVAVPAATTAVHTRTSPPLGKDAYTFCTTVEKVWRAVDETVAGIEREPRASLFDLGLDSLAVAELVNQLEVLFGAECVNLDAVLENPSVAGIAKHLAPAPRPPADVAPVAGDSADGESPERSRGAGGTQDPNPRGSPGSDDWVRIQPYEDGSDQQAVMAAVLGLLDEIAEGVADAARPAENLFDAGMDSLGLAELVIKLEEQFGDEAITIDIIMEDPSVKGIVAVLAPAQQALPPGRRSAEVDRAARERGSLDRARDAREKSYSNGAPDRKKVIGGPARPRTKEEHDVSATSAERDPWILTTHVGSLPRSGDGGGSVAEIVKRQLAVGVDQINDGEWARDNYIADLVQRIEGIGGAENVTGVEAPCCVMPCASDMADVPLYSKRFTGGNGLITLNPNRAAHSSMACTGPLAYARADTLHASLQAFCAAAEAQGAERGALFYSTPSPGTVALFCEDRHFYDYERYVMELAEVVRHEYEAIAARGVMLQVDCPCMAMGRHTRFSHMTDDEFAQVSRVNVRAINHALQNIDPLRVRVHVCWGNYPGPHHHDLEADQVWPHLAQVSAKYLLVEGANSRHAHDWSKFDAAWLAPWQVLVPGVIDCRSANVEHPGVVAERILNYAKVLGPARVIAGTDCGFATTAKSAAITADIVWHKLHSLVAGARLATQAILDSNAPAKCPRTLAPTGFRVVLLCPCDRAVPSELEAQLAACAWNYECIRLNPAEPIEDSAHRCFEKLRWSIDYPSVFIGVGRDGLAAAAAARRLLAGDRSCSRRPVSLAALDVSQGDLQAGPPAGPLDLGPVPASPEDTTKMIAVLQENTWREMGTQFDKQTLVPTRHNAEPVPPPPEADVVVIGAGLLGLYSAARLKAEGYSVAIVEQRSVVGGIWSVYANSFSQVNSSEGGYNIKALLGEEAGNRDHSTSAEILSDIRKLAKTLDRQIYCGNKVLRVVKTGDAGYMVVTEAQGGGAHVTTCRGAVLCINDRVGTPRPFQPPGFQRFRGVIADGTSDQLVKADWKGKRVVVVGMGAFAVENARTALERGAAHVTVVCRRHGTVCPKIIDYLNFVKPFDDQYRHDASTNIKQMRQWSKLYRAAGATIPECWPKEIKHEGHTISVSDVWFVAHHLKKLATVCGTVASMDNTGVVLESGEHVGADIVVGCIGFSRNTVLCEAMTGLREQHTTNYLGKHLMYLADAEIDHGAFNSFFGSSVLEMAKFFTEVYIEGLRNEAAAGAFLWGEGVPTVSICARKWSDYIAAANNMMANNARIKQAAADQVASRTAHFHRTLPPQAYVESNRAEWEEMHTRLNGGVPVPEADQLPYYFGEAAAWC